MAASDCFGCWPPPLGRFTSTPAHDRLCHIGLQTVASGTTMMKCSFIASSQLIVCFHVELVFAPDEHHSK